MNKTLKWTLWAAGTAAVLGTAAHWTLAHELNSERTRRAVGGWLERATGCRVSFGRVSYGVFPPRLALEKVEVAKDEEGVEARVEKVSVGVNLRRGEVTALEVTEPVVRLKEKKEGGAGRGGGSGPQKDSKTGKGTWPELPKRWVPLKRFALRDGRLERLDEGGAARVVLDGVEVTAEDVSLDKPVSVAVSFGLGTAANPCKAELHAGVPSEWWNRAGEWPLQARAEALVEDLAAAERALDVADAGPLQRPGLWLNCVGTLSNGVTVSGAFTDGQRYQSPDITVNWKGVARLSDGRPEGTMEFEVPILRWGAVAAKGGKALVEGEATAEGGWRVGATGSVARVEGAAGEEGVCGKILAALAVSEWASRVPGLAARAAGKAPEEGTGTLGKDIEFGVEWKGGSVVEVGHFLLGDGPYRLSARGSVDGEARTLALEAELMADPQEVGRTLGWDRAAELEGWMPFRGGMAMFPLKVGGTFGAPRVEPEYGTWKEHFKAQLADEETEKRIDKEVQRGLDKLKLHSKDRENVETGLKLLQGLFAK